MVILWTDALIFGLLSFVFFIAYYLHDKEHIKRPLISIKQSHMGMASLVVLLFFMAIGILDSLHFKQNGDRIELIIGGAVFVFRGDMAKELYDLLTADVRHLLKG